MPQVLADARANLQESAEDLHRNRDRAASRHRRVFRERRAAGIQAGDRCETARGVSPGQPAVIAALKDYEKFLRTQMLPQVERRFPAGRGELREEAGIRRDGRYSARPAVADRLRRSAREPEEVQRDRREDRPEENAAADFRPISKRTIPRPDKLLEAFRDQIVDAARFHHRQEDHHHSVAGACRILEETPPFMRALTFASMDTPGPYETVAKEAFFNVTLPEKRLEARARRGFHARLQSRHHPEHRDS